MAFSPHTATVCFYTSSGMLATPVMRGRNQHHPSGTSRILGHLYDPRVRTFFSDLIKQLFTVFINILTWLIKDNLQQKTIMLLLKGTDITVVSRVTFSIISIHGFT